MYVNVADSLAASVPVGRPKPQSGVHGPEAVTQNPTVLSPPSHSSRLESPEHAVLETEAPDAGLRESFGGRQDSLRTAYVRGRSRS